MKTRHLLFAILFSASVASGASKEWTRHYALVNKDIQSIERLKYLDLELRVRLFELYGEKLALLIEVENELRIAYLNDSKAKSKLDKALSLQKSTLSKIQRISSAILKVSKDRNLEGKIHYYRALSYLFVKDYRSHEIALLKAERSTTDKKLLHAIRVKLADYYYNEKKYAEAGKRYTQTLGLKKYKWRSKLYYNLAWCEFKLGKKDSALKTIQNAYALSASKYYFDLGDQLIDSIMLFYANSQRTEEGLDFLTKIKQDSPDQLLRYAHHVYELGKKSDVLKVFEAIKTKSPNLNDKTKVLAKEVEIYRNLKLFNKIQFELKAYEADYIAARGQQRSIEKLNRDALVTSVLGYNGFLQELIKSKSYSAPKKRIALAGYIYKNLSTLSIVDPANAVQYAFFQGETYLELGQYKTATKIYLKGIKKANASKNNNQEYLKKTFDSTFKALELGKEKNPAILTYVFDSFLKHFPNDPKADNVHQRLMGLSLKSKDKALALKRLAAYNKRFPNQVKIQRDYYKSILNYFIEQKDTASMQALVLTLKKGFLNFNDQEIQKVSKIFEGLKFEEYEEMAKAGKVEDAIKGFDSLYMDKGNHYTLRVNALRKKQYYQDRLKNYTDLGNSLIQALNLYTPVVFKQHANELNFYLRNMCLVSFKDLKANDRQCLQLESSWAKKRLNYPAELSEMRFRKIVVQKEFEEGLKLAGNNPTRMDYLFQTLSLAHPSFDHKVYQNFYSLAAFKSKIDSLAMLGFWRLWFRTLDLDKLESYASDMEVRELKGLYQQKINALVSKIKARDIQLPTPPASDEKKEITFEVFSSYLDKLVQATGNGFTSIENGFKQVDPNFLPYLISVKARELKSLIPQITGYKPIAKDANLVAAIEKELQSIADIYAQKARDYEQFYRESVAKTIQGVGAENYNENLMRHAFGGSVKTDAFLQGY